ncbi:N-acetylmuramoyl-L-alanine amidase family protein [Luteimonas huabeiensis]|uniref:N-acetylmuramoyl-L-alanine amidase family protein n=1 Tax=Luteimonas huabeiensis TaxID=1244513 RepID=UPI0009DECADA|nr:N-acetylmuramoyl-L-alanine amidase [Luteimonas huabeiensis]
MKSPTPLPSHLGARRLIHVFLGAILLIGMGQLHAQNNPPPPITEANIPELEAMLTQELQHFVDRQPRLPGQARKINVRVSVDLSTSDILIDLGIGYIPRGDFRITEELNNKLIGVSRQADDILSGIVTYRMLSIRFDGKRIQDIFPDDFSPRHLKGTSQRAARDDLDLIVVSPGHGYYYHHGSQSWVLQRPDPYAGTANIYEDLVTPAYSDTLTSLLLERSHETIAAIANTRRTTDSTIHPESGHPWWMMGARYMLKDLHPDKPELWNMFPNGTEPGRINLREYDEDIRSRPEYANFLGAHLLISLHTNAAPSNPQTRGADIFIAPDDAESATIARSVACHMREQIQATPSYKDYQVNLDPLPGQHGENTRANMPSILIELGFATNLQDAIALRSPAFRAAAMRGVEKGYRSYKQGEASCEQFSITDIPNATASREQPARIPISFSGYPQFPVRQTIQAASCPSGWICRGNELIHQNGPSPLHFTSTCNVGTAGTVRWRTTLIDSDGVKTEPFESEVVCLPSSGSTASQAAATNSAEITL